jgi:phenylpropionate dioxygenase-like ring-hydroxylating dioxygenase large terminal subunit
MNVFVNNPALRNAWYPVAEPADITSDPASVRLLGQDLVLWRGEGDEIIAAPDRCPHREAPLSIGCVTEGSLVCAYHGWKFGSGGRCVDIPSASSGDAVIPPAAHLQEFQAQERYGLIWVCPGTPPGDIAMIAQDDDPAFRRINTGVEFWRTSATRMVDNFLDRSHFPWVHTGTFGDGLDPRVSKFTMEQLDDDFTGYAYEVDANNPAEAAITSGTDTETVHRHMTTGFHLPILVRSTILYEDGLEHIILMTSTPVDDATALFSFVIWRNDDHSVDAETVIAFDRAIGAEDKVMLEQVPGVLRMGQTDLASVQSDKASVEWRRQLAAMLDLSN